MLKICHYFSYTISWYSGKLEWFNEKYIILWPSLLYSSSCDNIITQLSSIMETKNIPLSIHPLIGCNTAFSLCVIKPKISIISDYVLIDCKKLQIIKWRIFFKDNIEIGNFEYLYVNLCFLQHIIINIYNDNIKMLQ